MRVFGTDIHIVTFLFIVLETIFFVYQFYHYLCWPQDKTRKYYLILLGLLIVKNVAMGLFPDPQYQNIPMVVQYGLTYAAGFFMASYFPYYFYKSYDLRGLRFHATYGIFLFLYLPFIVIFLTEYTLTKNIDQSLAHGLYIPAAYSLVLAYVMWKSIQKAFKKEIENREYWEIIAMYFSVIPFIAIAFFPNITQVTEAIITNLGFTILTFLFIRRSILQSREDRKKLFELIEKHDGSKDSDLLEEDSQFFEQKLSVWKLTPRQKEVVRLVKYGLTYPEISEMMHISDKTVKKHIENIFRRVGATNKMELIHKILHGNPDSRLELP